MIKRHLFYSFFILIALFLSSTLTAQITSPKVDLLVERAMKEFNVAGVAVAIVKDGKIIHKKGYGVKSVTTNQPVDAQTNFQIASNSKAFTAAALAILVDEGKIKWTDKVVDYIPEFKMYNDYVTQNFSIEDLLCHRSGLGLGVGDLMIFPSGSDFTIHDIAKSFQHFKPVSGFRTKFDYDNLLYLVAGEITARVSQMSWEAFVEQKIMQPLEMNNSAASFQRADKKNLAIPHSTEGISKNSIRTINHLEGMVNGAAGGIVSNVDDLSKWLLVQLNQGKYGPNLEKKLFSVAQQNKMWQIHTSLKNNPNPRYNNHFSGYGLGWFLTDMKGNLSVSHTGGLPGMLSKISLIPDLNLGLVILTNTESGGAAFFTAVNNIIIDSYLGLGFKDYVSEYATLMQQKKVNADSVTANVWEQVEASKKTKINPEDYIGIYEDNWFGKMEVFLKGKQLWIKSYRSPKLNGSMQLYKANTFAVKWKFEDMNCDAFAMFRLNEEGKAQGILFKGISPAIDFSFDFQDLDFKRVSK